MGFLNLRSIQREAADAKGSSHTLALSTALRAIRAAAVDVETGARGFGLVGEDWILEPYTLGHTAGDPARANHRM